jgi:hypothetical protein
MDAVDNFELSSKTPFKLFEFSIEDFKLEIVNAALFVPADVNWQQLLTKFEIIVHIIAGEVFQYSGPIHLFTNPYSMQPFFELNKVIDNRVFDSDTDLSAVNKVVVKIELIQFQNIIEPFVLNFKHKLKTIN